MPMSPTTIAERPAAAPPAPAPSPPPEQLDSPAPPWASVKRHPVLTYFALTFAISVGAAVLAAGPDGLPATLDRRLAVGLATLAGPSVAGLRLTGLVAGRP